MYKTVTSTAVSYVAMYINTIIALLTMYTALSMLLCMQTSTDSLLSVALLTTTTTTTKKSPSQLTLGTQKLFGIAAVVTLVHHLMTIY